MHTNASKTKNNSYQLKQHQRNRPAPALVDNRPEMLIQRKLHQLMVNHGKNPTKNPTTTNQQSLPAQLKTGVEHLSGMSMDNVKVHYNSDKPHQLQAHAYAQGDNIHLAPGQEKHLPHEAWHLVQQKQGRVKPTAQLKGQLNINDNSGLEHEADVMGAKAMQFKPHYHSNISPTSYTHNQHTLNQHIVQRKVNYNSASQSLNGGQKIKDRATLIQALLARWPHLGLQRITETVDGIIEAGGKPWTAAAIHDGFKQMVVKESSVPTTTNGRPPTLYTYTHTPAGNQISDHGIPQGPHTLAYGAIHEALYVGHGGDMTLERFNQQISKPSVWWAKVLGELSPSQQADSDLGDRLHKAHLSYSDYYNEAIKIWAVIATLNQAKQQQAMARIKLLMGHLMQLDPYATYAWANKHSDPDVSGKGENTNIMDDKNIDTGGHFNHAKNLDSYIETRRELV